MPYTDPDGFKSPGQIVQATLERKGWTQRVLALVLDVHETSINKVISDRKSITAELALALGEVLQLDPERLLQLQKSYDLAKARIKARPDPGRNLRAHLLGGLPVSEMIRRGWIRADSIRDVETVESELARFFGVPSAKEIEILPHAARKTEVTSEATPVQMAWLYRVKHIASEMLVRKYTPMKGRGAVKALQSLLISPEASRKAPRILSESGIRFVIVEALSGSKIDGACFWLNEISPVIGMTLRYDRIDNFWFVLRHELEHIIQGHGKTAVMLDAELEGDRAGTGPTLSEEERIANEAAADFCVSQQKMRMFISRKDPYFAEKDVIAFSKMLGVHPGLIAGQLQHYTGRYNLFRKHLAKIRPSVGPSAVVDGWGDVVPVDE
ncbi:MAG: HigA family addiction module antidote protein [Deltaproteobacteria bacterium]|nr:HigA family addiction module antidote protein [Deltaproteobacteria bacterium]